MKIRFLPLFPLLALLGGALMAAQTRPADDTRPAAKPGTLTLHVKNEPITKVLTEIHKQSGVSVVCGRMYTRDVPPAATVTLDVDGQDFWPVMRQISAQTQWTTSDDREVRDTTTIQLRPGAALAERPVSISGGCMVTVNEIVNNQNPEATREPARDLRVYMTAFFPPGFNLLACRSAVAIDQALDERGQSLVPADKSNPKSLAGALPTDSNPWLVPLRVSLPYAGDAPPRRLVSLRGTIRYVVQEGPDEPWVIEDPQLSTNVTRQIMGEKITLSRMVARDSLYTFHLRTTNNTPFGNVLARLLPEPPNHRVHLISVHGEDWPCKVYNGSYGYTDRENEFDLSASTGRTRGQTVPEPSIFVFYLPTKVEERTLSFEFKDLPLP